MKTALIPGAILVVAVISTAAQFAERIANVKDLPPATVNAIPPVGISSSLFQSGEAGPEVKLVLLALLPHGFESNQMQLDAGEYLFIVGNRTGLKEVNVRLDREGRDRVAATIVGARQRDWKQRFKLTPGTYLVRANDNPDWTCRIVVGP